jgi:hypothetical protein
MLPIKTFQIGGFRRKVEFEPSSITDRLKAAIRRALREFRNRLQRSIAAIAEYLIIFIQGARPSSVSRSALVINSTQVHYAHLNHQAHQYHMLRSDDRSDFMFEFAVNGGLRPSNLTQHGRQYGVAKHEPVLHQLCWQDALSAEHCFTSHVSEHT